MDWPVTMSKMPGHAGAEMARVSFQWHGRFRNHRRLTNVYGSPNEKCTEWHESWGSWRERSGSSSQIDGASHCDTATVPMTMGVS